MSPVRTTSYSRCAEGQLITAQIGLRNGAGHIILKTIFAWWEVGCIGNYNLVVAGSQ